MKADSEAACEGHPPGCENEDACAEIVPGTAARSGPAYQHRIAFGRNIQEARTRAGLALGDLASMSGISVNCIAAIEAGRCDPRLKAMVALANALRSDLRTLLTRPHSQE
jgi:DNA-binding XRE family transcriptional regulator